MSMLDKLLGAVSPLESESVRRETRRQAAMVAQRDDWLALVLKHHAQIEDAFDSALSAASGSLRAEQLARLAKLLGAHSLAEETALYPALATIDDPSYMTKAFVEQATAKAQLAQLAALTPNSQDFADKLGHLRGAVLHHMYEEESSWFLELKQQLAAHDQATMREHYQDEYDMFMEREAQREIALDATTH